MNGFDRGALVQWAESRQTSLEVAEAIFDVATENGLGDDEAQRIWESPSSEELEKVKARAWQLAHVEEDTLHWGVSTIRRS